MQNFKLVILSCALVSWIGCDYAGGKQISASRDESHQAPNRGSATDISTNGELPIKANNAADNGHGGPVQREEGNYQSQPIGGQTSDSELASQVKVALTTGSTGTTGAIAENQLTKIDVQVKEGVVTLSGPVSSDEEKESIGRQVKGFKGVKRVQNELTVGAPQRRASLSSPWFPAPAGINRGLELKISSAAGNVLQGNGPGRFRLLQLFRNEQFAM